MKLKFTRKTWYFFLLAAAAMSMLGGFAVLGGMDFSGLELIVFCITGIAVLFLAAQKGAPAKDKRSYTLVFVLLMLSKLAAGGWAGDLCSALVWPGLLAIEYGHGRPIQRPLQLVCISEALRLLFWLLTKYAGMSALAFWTNIMFVLLACARGWAALVLYKTQEETGAPFWRGPVLLPVWVRGCGCAEKSFPNRTKRKRKNSLLRTLPCLQASGGPYG